jgi:hypothetical protein
MTFHRQDAKSARVLDLKIAMLGDLGALAVSFSWYAE